MYQVYFGKIVVGTVQLIRNGLYYRVKCCCRFPQLGRYRIYAVSKNSKIDLGLCVPIDSGFGFNTSVKAKLFDSDEIRFEALLDESTFIPVEMDQPFSFLTVLQHCRFAIYNGKAGIIIPDKDLRDSDRNLIHPYRLE